MNTNAAIGKATINDTTSADDFKESSSIKSQRVHGVPELAQPANNVISVSREDERTVEEIEESEKGWFAYFKTRNFYIVLLLGHVDRHIPSLSPLLSN